MRPLSGLGAACLAFAIALAACTKDRDASASRTSTSDPTSPSASASVAPSAATAPSASTSPPAASAAPPSDELVVIAGGDVNLGRRVGRKILRDPASVKPFEKVRPYLSGADVVFVNLESQLSDQGGETQHPKNRLIFTGPPGGARVLARSGIDIVSLANNHAWDYGQDAFFETLRHLDEAGVAYVGASQRRQRQFEPTVLKRRGWSIAFFAVTAIWNQGNFGVHPGRYHVAWADADRLIPRIRQAKQEHDLVVLSYHGGFEYQIAPAVHSKKFVREVMQRTKVDAFIGHHPHVPLGIEWYEGRPAFYSLGNLVFNMHSKHPWTGTSFLVRMRFRRDGPPRFEACPYHILWTTPHPFDGKGKGTRELMLRRRLRQASSYLGGTSVGATAADGCLPVSPVLPAPAPSASSSAAP